MEDNKLKIKEFHLQIYPRRLFVCIGGTIEDIRKVFTAYDGENEFPQLEDVMAIAAPAMKKKGKWLGEVVWFLKKEWMDGPIVCHEAAHAAMDICRQIGITVDMENQEPFAYLMEYIFKQIEYAREN